MICGKIWGEPRYGKTPGHVQRFTARPDEVELAGGALLAVPRARATQVDGPRPAGRLQEPQRARGRQDQAQRVGPHHTRDLAALILSKASEGRAIPNRDFHGPPVTILREDGRHAQGEIGSEKRLDRRRRLARAGLADPCGHGAPDHDHAAETAWKHRRPQALPGWDCGRGFAGVGLPAAPFAG
jgi:hypothetical protein